MAEEGTISDTNKETGLDPGVLHVFDLPQLYTKPPPSDLLSALAILEVRPPSWDPSSRSRRQNSVERPRVHPDGVTDYLTKIVSSSLKWISNDEEKEAVWEVASLRLAERSGRTAMPAMQRTFSIPLPASPCLPSGSDKPIELIIHEPALTADNLGLKTWAASYMLAKRLRSFDLPALRRGIVPGTRYEILELGSGTGLVGMAAAAVFSTGAILTDLPTIEANLARNVEANRRMLAAHSGCAAAAVLDWSQPQKLMPSAGLHGLDAVAVVTASPLNELSHLMPAPPHSMLATPAPLPISFPVILAADCIYDADHPRMLVNTIAKWLTRSANARLVIELPFRDAYLADAQALRTGVEALGMDLIDQGEEVGVDDWGGVGDVREVRCWSGVWKWTNVHDTPQ